jgi:hypothetical protein
MKKIIVSLALISTAIISASTFASAKVVNTYDYLNLSYAHVDVDDDIDDEVADISLKGYSLEASKLLTDNVFVTASWLSVDDSDSNSEVSYKLDADILKISIGYRHGIAASTDIYGQVGYVQQKQSYDLTIGTFRDTYSETIDGYSVKAGVKHSFGRLEGGVYVERMDGGSDIDGSTFVGIESRYKFNKSFAIVADYAKDSDMSLFKVGASFMF